MTKTKGRERARNIDMDNETPTPKATKTARKGGVQIEDAIEAAQKEMRSLAIEAYTANLAKNAASKREEKARGALLGLMKAHKIKNKIFENVVIGDDEATATSITLEADVNRPENEKANVLALYKAVPADTFLQIVSASKEAIVKLAGQAVFEQVKTLVEGEERVVVKTLKA